MGGGSGQGGGQQGQQGGWQGGFNPQIAFGGGAQGQWPGQGQYGGNTWSQGFNGGAVAQWPGAQPGQPPGPPPSQGSMGGYGPESGAQGLPFIGGNMSGQFGQPGQDRMWHNPQPPEPMQQTIQGGHQPYTGSYDQSWVTAYNQLPQDQQQRVAQQYTGWSPDQITAHAAANPNWWQQPQQGPMAPPPVLGSQYGANGMLGLEDLGSTGLSLTDQHYLAGLGYYQNPNDPAAKANFDSWNQAMQSNQIPGGGPSPKPGNDMIPPSGAMPPRGGPGPSMPGQIEPWMQPSYPPGLLESLIQQGPTSLSGVPPLQQRMPVNNIMGMLRQLALRRPMFGSPTAYLGPSLPDVEYDAFYNRR